jgi:protein SCO1/2
MTRLIALLAAALLAGCMRVPAPSFTGTALPPGPAPNFTLTSDAGVPWTLSHQHGLVVALFFGYTHCGDTCPATLAKLADALHRAGASAQSAEIAFVTVDANRDRPSVIHAYLQRFLGARIVGLTGTARQLQAVERAYHVWAERVAGPHGGDDYDEGHSSVTFLIDRDGNERVVHGDDDPLHAFLSDFRTLLQ